MRKLSAIVALVPAVALAACAPTPIAPPVVRSGTTVNASFGKAWNAVIDEFAQRNLPIKTIDKSSGIIVTEQLKANVDGVADCGTMMGTTLRPTDASYNVLVRGDSTSAVVKVTPRFVRVGTGRGLLDTSTVAEECSSNGTFETQLESHIKATAEGHAGS